MAIHTMLNTHYVILKLFIDIHIYRHNIDFKYLIHNNNNMDHIINTFTTASETHFLITLSFHRYASELFPQVAPMLGELNTHLENITWNKSLSFADGKLVSI